MIVLKNIHLSGTYQNNCGKAIASFSVPTLSLEWFWARTKNLSGLINSLNLYWRNPWYNKITQFA